MKPFLEIDGNDEQLNPVFSFLRAMGTILSCTTWFSVKASIY